RQGQAAVDTPYDVWHVRRREGVLMRPHVPEVDGAWVAGQRHLHGARVGGMASGVGDADLVVGAVSGRQARRARGAGPGAEVTGVAVGSRTGCLDDVAV